MDEKEN
jgi:tetratricopeptide (TPR) repeat protein